MPEISRFYGTIIKMLYEAGAVSITNPIFTLSMVSMRHL